MRSTMQEAGSKMPALRRARTSLDIRPSKTCISPPPPESWTGGSTPLGGKFNDIDRSGAGVTARVQASEDLLARFLEDQSLQVDPTHVKSAQDLESGKNTTDLPARPRWDAAQGHWPGVLHPAATGEPSETQITSRSSPASPKPSVAPRFAAYKGEFGALSEEDDDTLQTGQDRQPDLELEAQLPENMPDLMVDEPPLINAIPPKKTKPRYSDEEKITCSLRPPLLSRCIAMSGIGGKLS